MTNSERKTFNAWPLPFKEVYMNMSYMDLTPGDNLNAFILRSHQVEELEDQARTENSSKEPQNQLKLFNL